MTPAARFEELLEIARGDDAILRLILYGSRAAGMFVREDSDWDVWLIIRDDAFADYEARYDTEHGEPLEIGTDTVDGLRSHGEPGTSHAWNRYAFRHAQVLVDKLDGEIGSIVESKRILPEGAGPAIAAAAFDGYANSTYRSLKAHRLGELLGSQLDADDAVSSCSMPSSRSAAACGRGRSTFAGSSRRSLSQRESGVPTCFSTASKACSESRPLDSAAALSRRRELARSEGHGPVFDSWGRRSRCYAEASLSLRREPLGQEARAVEGRELVVAADGLAVDRHERHRPLPAQVVDALAKRRVVVERDLLEGEAARVEQHPGADAVAAPLRRIEADPGHRGA